MKQSDVLFFGIMDLFTQFLGAVLVGVATEKPLLGAGVFLIVHSIRPVHR
jgi:hypothetical protein